MAALFDPLSRSTSNESVRSRSSHALSIASSSNRKGRHADTETSNADVERANLSMPQPVSKSNLRQHNLSQRSPRSSLQSDETDGHYAMRHSAVSSAYDAQFNARAAAIDNAITGAIDAPFGPGRSTPDSQGKRLSYSSMHNDGRGTAAESAELHTEKATTAAHNISVTTTRQNGSLSPSLGASGRDSHLINNGTNNSAGSSMPPPTSPVVHPRENRAPRGRSQAVSRRVSASNPGSASASVERSNASSHNPPPRIGTIGICALDSKARSKPSRNILNRLVGKDNDFDVIIFGDKVILDESVENWPVCDFLISFFSDGFPLEKAIAYAKLRRPFCVNDLPMQTLLWDRRLCLVILDKLGVPTPKRIEVNRDGGPVILTKDIAQRANALAGVHLPGSADGRGGGEAPPKDIHLEDDDDTLVVDGKRLSKPFVEKPVSGEDHNIYIYYPRSQGGGGRRLFRKVNNKSSEKDEDLIVPRCVSEEGASYIYEQFLKVENAEDVKAYTVGPDFCHAETRKSPVVDGVVKRNPNGKELRYVTPLTPVEQEMASKIAIGFGQQVCGFDLLRVEDQSFVIDVNGWSFVKDNNEYYDKCAAVLRSMFVREKMKWEGLANHSEIDETEIDLQQPTSTQNRPHRPSSTHKEGLKDVAGHRKVLKSVFRSRSISQLRDSVTNAAYKMGHSQDGRGQIGLTSPLTSPPNMDDRVYMQTKRSPSSPVGRDDILAPSATPLSTIPPHKHRLIPDQSSQAQDLATSNNINRAVENLPPLVPAPASKSQWKLKGMVAVIRHADRTPKQKFKFAFHTKPFVDLLKGHQEEVLLVGEAALKNVQCAVRQALEEGIEDQAKLRQLQLALARKGGWPGTKVQIKPMFKKPKGKEGKDVGKGGKAKGEEKNREKTTEDQSQTKRDTSNNEKVSEGGPPFTGPVESEEVEKWKKSITSSPKMKPREDSTGSVNLHGSNRSDSIPEITMSRAAAAENNLELDKLQLVMKWGGEPTHSARYQAADLGDNMRNDLLLMNREVLSDVSIYTSSERRVKTSAQIFASAFLGQQDLDESDIVVRKDLLDDSNAAKDEMDKVKKKLKPLLRKGAQPPEQFAWPKDGTPEPYLVVRKVTELMKFHRRVMRSNFSSLQSSDAVTMLEKLKSPSAHSLESNADSSATANSGSPQARRSTQASAVQARWCTGEDAALFKERWEKLFDEFTDAEKVDPSKISELYDTMKFDALHNRQFLEWVFTPNQSALLDDSEEGVGRKLVKTESRVAREEFLKTHDGQEPSHDNNVDRATESQAFAGPSRSSTTSTTASGVIVNGDGQRPSFSQRMGIRRRSADLMSAARYVASGAASSIKPVDPSQSYFNLHRGSVPAGESKVKNDVRLEKLNELYSSVKILFDFIGPQEYGITDAEKLEIGLLTSLPLLKEIVKDLEEVQASDDTKSFIYFTKESHIYTLLNCILEGGIHTKIARNAIPELDYLSQICFELYESENAEQDIDPSNPDSNFNYSIRITISPGCHTFDPLDVQLDSKHCIGCAPRRSLTNHGDWKDVIETLRAKFHTVKLPKSFTAVNLSEKTPQEFVSSEAHDEQDLEEVKVPASPIPPVH